MNEKWFGLFWILAFVLCLAFWGAVIFVAIHFISMYW